METRNRHAQDGLTVRRALFILYLAGCGFCILFLTVLAAT